jgi:hypothetical protein
MRCFVAIALPEPVKKLLVQVQDTLRRADADVKWVEEENLHLSLKFLGEVDEEAVSRLKGILSVEALRWPAMDLTYAGMGTFPERGEPRVVWAGCAGDVQKLAALAGAGRARGGAGRGPARAQALRRASHDRPREVGPQREAPAGSHRESERRALGTGAGEGIRALPLHADE